MENKNYRYQPLPEESIIPYGIKLSRWISASSSCSRLLQQPAAPAVGPLLSISLTPPLSSRIHRPPRRRFLWEEDERRGATKRGPAEASFEAKRRRSPVLSAATTSSPVPFFLPSPLRPPLDAAAPFSFFFLANPFCGSPCRRPLKDPASLAREI